MNGWHSGSTCTRYEIVAYILGFAVVCSLWILSFLSGRCGLFNVENRWEDEFLKSFTILFT